MVAYIIGIKESRYKRTPLKIALASIIEDWGRAVRKAKETPVCACEQLKTPLWRRKCSEDEDTHFLCAPVIGSACWKL